MGAQEGLTVTGEKRLTFQELFEKIFEGRLRFYADEKQGHWACESCGEPAEQMEMALSVHLNVFGADHAGPGRVSRQNVPYCPNCDPVPGDSGCIHVPAGLGPNKYSLYRLDKKRQWHLMGSIVSL